MKIGFHGADQGVTGSCHLIECAGKRILIDCGLYQGGRSIEEENEEPFGFDPASIDYLLLTHAHLDHCGRIPLLASRGFKGEVITTAASKELARLVMLDAAHLQEEEAERNNRRSARHGRRRNHEEEPLYTVLDALNSLEFFGRSATYGNSIELAKGIRATFLDAGHILGSASILLELQEGPEKRRVFFSGDLGNRGRPLLGEPEVATDLDVIVMETTYGDRAHKAMKPTVDEFYDAINDTFKRGGNVIIPTFALERAQEILYYLREGVEKGLLSQATQVFLDSPMAISATQIFRRHPEAYGDATAELFESGKDPFQLPGLHFTRETAQSMALNRLGGGAIIMAGSGMCTGGRVRHHLKHNLWRRDSSVIFVGFAAHGTLARRIVDGAESVRIFGEDIPVMAQVHTINGFSAHADQNELLDWHRNTGGARVTYLVHGDEEAMEHFATQLQDTEVRMPELHTSFDL